MTVKTPSFGACLAACLLAAHAALLLHSAGRHFVTRNEVGHIPAGVLCWESGAFHVYQVNPPLPRMLAALPVYLAGPATDTLAFEPSCPGYRPEWEVAQQFAAANADRYLELIRLARLAGVGWSLLGGWLVFRWANELYGPPAGLVPLAVWCFDPNILAHAQLATPDLPAAVAGATATYLFSRYLRSGATVWAAAAGCGLGVALLTKFTLVVLPPVWLLLAACSRPPGGRRAVLLLLLALLAVAAINLGYGFTGTGRPLGDYDFVSRLFGGDPAAGTAGNRFRATWLGRLPVPLPTGYLEGVDLQRRDFETGLGSYLNGTWRPRGWWYYYVYGLAVKVPIGTLALAAAGFAAWAATWVEQRQPPPDSVLWLTGGVILAFVSANTGYTNHVRYVLPLAPFGAVAIGRAAAWARRGPAWRRWFVSAALGGAVASSLAVYPNSLSYFNEAAGGPENGWRLLADSNIDWGQDLLLLEDWERRHPEAAGMRVAYHHLIDCSVLGRSFVPPPPDPTPPPRRRAGGPEPGYFALDVHSLQHGPYRYFRHFRPVARAGYSIYIYHITAQEADRVRRLVEGPAAE